MRYVSTRLCVECLRLRDAQAKATAKLNLPPEKPLPPPRVNGVCRHGIGLKAFCRDCEISWRKQQHAERDARDYPYQGFAHVGMIGTHRSA
jgi:hypothetical protein